MDTNAKSTSGQTWQDGLAALRAGQVEQAVEILSAAVNAEPNNASALQYLGIAHGQRGEWEQSIAALSRAARLDPYNAPARYNLAEVYRQMGRVAEARSEYEEALKIDPTYTAAQQALAALPPPEAPTPARPPLPGMPASPAPLTRVAPTPPLPGAAPGEEPIGIVQLCLRIITSPQEALEYDLPRYVRGHRAIANIAIFYAICITPGIAMQAIRAAAGAAEGAGEGLAAASVPAVIIAQVVGSLLLLVVQSAAIALVNVIIGRSMGFLTDTAELALRFALVGGTTQLVGCSVGLVATLGGLIAAPLGALFGTVALATAIWTWYLFVLVVMVTYDYGCLGAILVNMAAGLLLGATMAAVIAATSIIL